MGIFKEISPADVRTARSNLNQLVDIIEEDISGSNTRKKYQVFVTGGIGMGPGVTSSLFQTVYDQDYSLQTANPIFDMTYGVYSGSTVVASASVGEDASKKILFASTSLMMREKINIYRQFSQLLLGDASSQFNIPLTATTDDSSVDNALFLCFKRLFSRDQVKRETFAFQFYQSASRAPYAGTEGGFTDMQGMNIDLTSNKSVLLNQHFGLRRKDMDNGLSMMVVYLVINLM